MRSLSQHLTYHSFWLCLIAQCLVAMGLTMVGAPAVGAPANAQEDALAEQTSVDAATWIANEHDIERVSIELGMAGHFKLGNWTEVRFSISSAAFDTPPTITVVARDSDDVPVEFTAPPPVNQGNDLLYRVPVRIGRRNSNLQIQFVTGEGNNTKTSIREVPVTELAESIKATDRWFIYFGPEMGLADAIHRHASNMEDSTVYVPLQNANELPEQWYLMEGVNVIAWTIDDSAWISRFRPSQWDALETWLKLGGHMIISIGASAPEAIAPSQPLSRFTPGTFARVAEIRETAELEALVGREARVERAVKGAITVAVLENPTGIVRIEEGSRQSLYPLWIRRAVGFGMIDFFPFEMTAEPIASWEGRESLLRIVLDGISDRNNEIQSTNQAGNSVAHYGYTDIAGQLRMALDQFPGVRNVSFFLIGAILVIYLALIGPGDYFLLRRLGLRMEWTWITFPAVILMASGGIFAMATWAKGTALKLNQVEVIDVDLESGIVRSTSWFHLFSPDTQRYDVSMKPLTIPVPKWNQLVSWQGLAGSGLGGMNARQSIATVPTPYQIEFTDQQGITDASLAQLPVQIWSSKTLMARGWGEMEGGEFDPLIERESELIEGTLHNPTDMELTDCYVLHGRWAYYIPKLPAKGIARIVPGQSVQNVEKVLKRRSLQESSRSENLWDRQSTDVARIMEVAMFHNTTGGSSYTSLSNRFQGYIDLSSHLEVNRAVLIGKVEKPATRVEIDDELTSDTDSQTWSYVRIVYPTQRRSDSEIAQR